MARIRTTGTAPENALRAALRRAGVTYQLHPRLPGRPDVAIRISRIAIFVDGCFWHCCPKHGTKPKTNSQFWREKLAANVERDRRVNSELRARGWRVIRIWEHSLWQSPDRAARR